MSVNNEVTEMRNSSTFNDPRRLFQLWKELTGEDLMSDSKASTKKEGQKK